MKRKILMLMVLLTGFSSYLFAQQTITGNVIDKTDKSTLIGVSVYEKGTTNGTVTDFDGNYTISVAGSESVLVYSFVGYETIKKLVGTLSAIDVAMGVDAESLDEVVVVGYGTQKKSHLTGAISKVVNEKLDQVVVSRVDDALIGQVSGVNIQATSAEAGAAPTITIRGVGSITADSGPAVVVDGMVVDASYLGTLDMNDIESFEILKDAASAAIYGSEGSNGVILITTKTGKVGKVKLSYNTYTGYKSAFGSDDYKKNLGDWAAKEFAATGEISEATQYAQKIAEVTGIDRDWQDVFFNGGIITSHSIAASGGTEDTKYSTSLRYLHDEGVVITDDYKLYSAKVKIDSKISEKMKFGLSVTPSYSKRRALPTSVHNPLRQSPWLPIYHTEETLQFINRDAYPNVGVGDYFYENHLVELDLNGDGSDSRPRTTGDSNPYAQYVEREHYEYNTKLLGSTYLSYKIMDGLTAKTSLGVTLEQRKRTRWDGTKHHASGSSRAAYLLNNRYKTRMISDNTLSYNTKIGDHEISALAGITIQKRKEETSQLVGTGYSNDLLKNLQGATTVTSEGEYNIEKNKIGYFGRVTYAYANKYLVNASFRRDGSSVFGVQSKWGNFPAASLGWNVHNEDFLSGSDVLSKLKIRVSYGLTGAENFSVGDDLVNAYPYLAQLDNTNAIIDGGISTGVSPKNIANLLLQWEASEEFNPGIDFGFLNGRFSGSLDYYKRTSDKLLLNNPVSYVTGFNSGIVNLGKVENSGWEFELRTKNIITENFSWKTTFIASTNKNELLDYGDSDGALTEDGFGRNSQWINSVGNPISSFYGYVVDKEFAAEYWDSPWLPINGISEDVIVKDLNGDGLITDDDKTILGDPYPEITWSVTNEFKYKNIDFSFMIQGSQGAEVKNIGDQYFFSEWNGPTTSDQAVVDAGIISDASFLKARVLTDDVVMSAGYFSLRNVNIGYTLSDYVLSKLGIESLRIFATGQNLLYITSDDYHGFNPEFVDSNNTPQSYGAQRSGTPLFRTVSVGLNVNF
ncbi:SusC/RagA family TonB-linked outer membrane protein [Labilibaculum antarcticum]|uniref:SusC/RagA family TonB-linked outer membrane protein n=1 Tax=Labilibaculum antarcticum TaxID=1717717 RepID=A0A1Y1CNR3_9BACT|nr:TonB-dependent receptor [Labilibaculum antarcticum]BAX81592.1 SusC/RagA family TonB-linked outer membrane protein [Labilibaculum antarcticum]